MHYFDGGNCIGRFQLATNEVYIKLIEKITSTEWHNLVVRNKAMNFVNTFPREIKYVFGRFNQ
jgi:hypothetical protein